MRKVLSVWAAATVPMIVLSWVVAPTLAGTLSGPAPLPRALILCMTVGLVWQGVLVLALTWRETRSLRWERVRDALWLRPPAARVRAASAGASGGCWSRRSRSSG